MSRLIKAYIDELDIVCDQIETLWAESDEYLKDDYYLSDSFHDQLSKLYNRKTALKAMINDLKMKENNIDFEI